MDAKEIDKKIENSFAKHEAATILLHQYLEKIDEVTELRNSIRAEGMFDICMEFDSPTKKYKFEFHQDDNFKATNNIITELENVFSESADAYREIKSEAKEEVKELVKDL